MGQGEDATEMECLRRLAPAVRCVGVATAFFAVGCATSCGYGIWFYYRTAASNYFADPVDTRISHLALIGSLKQLLMTISFVYVTMLVLRCGAVIRRSRENAGPRLTEVLSAQRSCWYGAAALAVIYVLLSVASAVVSATMR